MYYYILITILMIVNVHLQRIDTVANKTCTVNNLQTENIKYVRYESLHEWKYLDFEYPSYESRQLAIARG